MGGTGKRFGTFGGVFVPNILTILGVIMYLRLGWVVGNAGLHQTLIILLIANLITLFTAFSVSSIATNMRMRGGGAYYLISRSLGAEVGGSIGIPLYLAQALVISLYIVGFAESLSLIFPHPDSLIVTLVTLTVLTVIALISSRLVIRIQYIILSVIVLSLVSFFLGKPVSFEHIHMNSHYTPGYDFWSVFAVFFPAVTGILSGVSLSGDLKDPAKSIPMGTILSVLAGALIYFLVAVWFSLVASPGELTGNNLIMVHIARWSPLIYAGIWGATLSSALANILAAPRTLQALAADGIVFRFFRRGRGRTNEPIVATVATFFLVAAVLLVGELNTIAPVLTIFFLITYGSVNIIAFLEGLIRRPGYRPTFRVHWFISLIGATGCVWVMFLINPVACITGFAFVFVIYLVLKRIQIQKSWGDFRKGIWSSLVQFSLGNLEQLTDHSVAWRPSLLLISRDLISRQKLIQIAFGLTQKSGFLTCINLQKSSDFNAEKLEEDSRNFKKMLHEKRINAFYKNAVVENYLSGQLIASQVHGVGEFSPNTILLDWSESIRGSEHRASSEASDQFRLIRFYSDLNKSLILLHVNPQIQRTGYQTVDIWWDPGQKNGSFMLLLAHLLTSGRYRGESRLNIKTVVLKDKLEQTHHLLEELVRKSRIRADINVLYPDTAREASLGLQFERYRRMQRRQKKWFTSLRGVFLPDNKEPVYREERAAEEEKLRIDIDPDMPEEDELEEAGDDAIKEKLSGQIKDKDTFIINRNIQEIIAGNSRQADLVMLGFNIPARGKEKKYIEKMESLLAQLPDTLLVNCPFDFELFD
jgi:solute carrier family 12 sodium/potassium/chloride transporter 2